MGNNLYENFFSAELFYMFSWDGRGRENYRNRMISGD